MQNILPVCAYDGRCYRKNPLHFQQYAHPLQFPATSTVDDTEATTVAAPKVDIPPEATKRSRSVESIESADAVSTASDARVDESPLENEDEGALASPPQLLHFLRHAPHLSDLVTPSGRGSAELATASTERPRSDRHTAAVPRIHFDPHGPPQPSLHWDGVAEVMGAAFAGMGFHAADVQCVLMAACAVKPSDPLLAFPGWQLVGPFEVALTYARLCSTQYGDAAQVENVDTTSTHKEEFSARQAALLHGGSAEEEVRRWRCGRFRYDPPECQTVAVRLRSADAAGPLPLTQANSTPSGLSLSSDGVHLCLHRDHPTDAPGMLVEGTAQKPTFTILNGTGWLAPFLAAYYRSQKDAASLVVTAALEDAVNALTAATKPVSDTCEKLKDLICNAHKSRSSSAVRTPKKVAATYSKLGIWVPIDKKTTIGYREPNIPDKVSYPRYLRDWEADFLQSAASATDASATAGDAVPLSRSANHDELASARHFSEAKSVVLDEIFVAADIANDEGDCGASLELGLNTFTCILADKCVLGAEKKAKANSQTSLAAGPVAGDLTTSQCALTAATTEPLAKRQRVEEKKPSIDPVLWHTYRILDCAYMLLQRPLYRHILRCHLPLLADADHPIPLKIFV